MWEYNAKKSLLYAFNLINKERRQACVPYNATVNHNRANKRRIYADQVIFRYSTTFQGTNTIQACGGFRGNRINVVLSIVSCGNSGKSRRKLTQFFALFWVKLHVILVAPV